MKFIISIFVAVKKIKLQQEQLRHVWIKIFFYHYFMSKSTQNSYNYCYQLSYASDWQKIIFNKLLLK